MQKLINGSMQNVFLSGERGGPSKMVESRFLFVGIRESKRISHISLSGERGTIEDGGK